MQHIETLHNIACRRTTRYSTFSLPLRRPKVSGCPRCVAFNVPHNKSRSGYNLLLVAWRLPNCHNC